MKTLYAAAVIAAFISTGSVAEHQSTHFIVPNENSQNLRTIYASGAVLPYVKDRAKLFPDVRFITTHDHPRPAPPIHYYFARRQLQSSGAYMAWFEEGMPSWMVHETMLELGAALNMNGKILILGTSPTYPDRSTIINWVNSYTAGTTAVHDNISQLFLKTGYLHKFSPAKDLGPLPPAPQPEPAQ